MGCSTQISFDFAPDENYLLICLENDIALLSLSGVLLRTFVGHTSTVRCCKFTTDGQYVISGSTDRTCKIWNKRTGACLTTLVGHTSPINTIAISADASWFVTGGEDRTVRVWEVGLLLNRHTLPVPSSYNVGNALRVHFQKLQEAFAGNKHFIVRGTTVHVTHLDGQLHCILSGHTNKIMCLHTSPDGNYAYTGCSGHTLKVWDVRTGECIRTLIGHTDGVSFVNASPTHNILVSSSFDRSVIVWDKQNGTILRTLLGHTDYVNCAIVSIDGQRVISGSADGSVRVWDIKTGACTHILTINLWIKSVATPKDESVYVLTDDGAVRLYSLSKSQQVYVLMQMWGGHGYFFSAQQTKIDNATGLSENNLRYLQQNGAAQRSVP